MGKIQTPEEYLQEHEFLRQAAELDSRVEKFVAEEISPLDLPSREKVLELVEGGIPLLQQEKFQEILLDAEEKFLPKIHSKLTDSPEENFPRSLLENLLRQDNEKVQEFFSSRELNENLIRLIFWKIVDKSVPEELKDFHFWEDEAKWLKNYCPICGRRAAMAQLRKFNEGRARYLLCGGCRTMWRYARVGCVYCGNEELKKMHIIEVENSPKVRVDVCDECHAYLKTYCDEDEEKIYLREWATIHLDILAEEKNLQRCGSIIIE